jgi:DNA-binding transcriptional LysR family regulator
MKRGVAVFDELNQGIKDIGFLADPTTGELRISASLAVAVGFASTAIDQLTRRYAGMNFQVLATDTAMAIRALDERVVDLAVVHIIGPIVEDHMNVEVLYDEPHVVMAGAQSPWTRKRKIELADLVDEPWTLPPPDSQFGSIVSEAFRSKRLGIPRTVVTSSFPVRQTLVATGRFLTMAPRGALAHPSRNSGVRVLPIELPTTRRPLGIISLKNRTPNPVGAFFIERAREIARSLQLQTSF